MAREFIRYVETKLVLAAVLMACLCGATAFGLYQHVATVHADTETLMAGNMRARHLSMTLALLQDAETGQRGYLLTGRTEYLEPYTHALERIDQSLATLHVDYAQDGAAKAMIAVLDRHVRDKLAELKLKTDGKGQFSVTWPAAGMYWLEASTRDTKTSVPQAKERRVSYSATLEVAP